MSKKDSVADVTNKMFNLLEKLESDDRVRVVKAAMTLLGEKVEQEVDPGGGGGQESKNEGQFFSQKDPNTKIEELAVAGRYLELKSDKHELEKNDLETVIKNARRNFDSKNFMRDLDNAKTKGFFTRDRIIKLSYYGQQYVDAMPDREAIKNLRKPKTKKRASKKSAGKKK